MGERAGVRGKAHPPHPNPLPRMDVLFSNEAVCRGEEVRRVPVAVDSCSNACVDPTKIGYTHGY